jgi:SAM-dependent methyltransferase
MDIRESYDSAAEAYAEHLSDELSRKPLDRHLLNRFAEELRGTGRVVDVGCGPGHVARYLAAQGVEMLGLDLSPRMIAVARRINPGLEFQVGDMHAIEVSPAAVAGIVLFYAFVHTPGSDLPSLLRELRRIVRPNGLLLTAFHVGDETMCVNDLFGAPVNLTFYFHRPAVVVAALEAAGFAVIEQTEREPYAGAEYPTRRGYLLARAVGPA